MGKKEQETVREGRGEFCDAKEEEDSQEKQQSPWNVAETSY